MKVYLFTLRNWYIIKRGEGCIIITCYIGCARKKPVLSFGTIIQISKRTSIFEERQNMRKSRNGNTVVFLSNGYNAINELKPIEMTVSILLNGNED